MGGAGKSDRTRTAERRSVLVLLAAFALIVQLLVPSALMAAQAAASGEIICTGYGLEMVRKPDAGAPQKGFAGLPCQDCLGPATAALPPPLLAVLPVAYPAAHAWRAETVQAWAAPARPPPRPPGQAPPTPHV